MIRAGPSCVTFAGATQASIEYSPVALMRSESFLLAVVEPCALPAVNATPQPPTQLYEPDSVKLAAGSTPLVSNAVLPLPVLNSYSAMTFASWRPPLDATIPSVSRSALLVTRLGSTTVGAIAFAIAVMPACINAASCAQLTVGGVSAQQLWNSVPRRTTKRELAGLSRSIFFCAAAYATSMSSLAKNGDCGTGASSLWQPTQYSCRYGS